MTTDSRTLWRLLGRHGVLDALYPSPGAPDRDHLGRLLAALDARYPVGVVLSVCVQVAAALPLLAGHGGRTTEVYERAIRGDAVLAVAATDGHGAGSDLMNLATTAKLGTEQVVLHGEKVWITNACTADYALVLARHRPQRHFTSFLWVLVPTAAPGVRTIQADTALFAGSGVGELRLDGVTLGLDHLVGRPGRGLALFARHIATERLAGGLWATAMCRRVLSDTYRTLTSRLLGDAPQWEHPAIRQRFADCLVRAWQLDAACAAYDAGLDPMVSSMLLKAAVAEHLTAVLGTCAQLLGAQAFAPGGVAQLQAEAAMFGIAGGAAGAMLAGIADHAEDLLQRLAQR